MLPKLGTLQRRVIVGLGACLGTLIPMRAVLGQG